MTTIKNFVLLLALLVMLLFISRTNITHAIILVFVAALLFGLHVNSKISKVDVDMRRRALSNPMSASRYYQIVNST